MDAGNHQIAFENVSIETPEALASLCATGKLPLYQLSLLEINDQKLSQSSAMIRYLARIGGFYDESDTDAVWCDMIAGSVADYAETAMQAAFQSTEDIAIAALRAQFKKFGPTFEARLAENGSGCCVGDRTTFADIVRTEALSAYLEWCPGILWDTPLLYALHERVSNDPAIARYLRSAQRYPKAAAPM
tara:strand:- start:745 stop:1311 length:567 start_codon:yes stop_codon:yes gene_type:complete